MDTRVTETLGTRKSLGRNMDVQNVRRKMTDMVRVLQQELDKSQLAELMKYYKPCQVLMDREERRLQSGISTALLVEQARLEKLVAIRNEKEAVRTTEYEEKEEDLKDKLDVDHDKIIEKERNKNNALLDNFVKDTSLNIQERAKEAEIRADIDSKKASCWWSLFSCCCVPPDLKQRKNELMTIEHQVVANRAAVPGLTAAADSGIAKINADRDKVMSELEKLAKSRVTLYDSDSDRDEERLADVKFLIQQAKKNQSHLLSAEALMSCLRFYECALYIFEHLPEDELNQNDPAVPLVSFSAKHTLEQFVGDDEALLTKQLNAFYCQDEDGLTTTFRELHEGFNELAKNIADAKRMDLLMDESLQAKLLGSAPVASPRPH